MRSLLLASAAMMAGPAVPSTPPPPPERPCPERKGSELRPVTPDKPSDAQRFNPGLF